MNTTDFTTLFKSLRNNSNLSLREFGRMLGLSAVYLCDLENGNRPPNEMIATKLIDTFRMTEEQQRVLFDSIASSTGDIPYDVSSFLKNNPDELKKVIEIMHVNMAKKK